MKELPTGMAEHLATGATTLCWCWRLTRRDGVILGFTDHDRDIVFDGTTFEAAAGFDASEIKDAIGLSVDNLQVSGAISSGRLEEADLAAGLYDDARIEIFRANWHEPSQHLLMRSGSIGEVRRNGTAFSTEIRGLAHYLQQPKGRLFQYGCDADVGDSVVASHWNSPRFAGRGSILQKLATRATSLSTGLSAFAADSVHARPSTFIFRVPRPTRRSRSKRMQSSAAMS